MKIRLNKFMAGTGLCSRRQADQFITRGKVKVNNQVVTRLGTLIEPGKNRVFYNDQEIILKPDVECVILNKPVGYTCTHRRFKQEKNIFSLLPKKYHGFSCVGRLDKNSRGLLLLTNHGQLAQKLSHPKFEHEKEYLVRLNKPITTSDLKKLKAGLNLDGLDLVKTKSVVTDSTGLVLKIILTQGKKRQIRRMLGYLGLAVLDLQRVRIDQIQLGNLTEGNWKAVNYKLMA